jgi:protein-histidine pros-kinase
MNDLQRGDFDRLLPDYNPDAMLLVTLLGEVRHWSRGATDMFGYPRAQALGRPLESLIVPPEECERSRWMLAQLHACGAGTFEVRRRHRDGTPVDVVTTGRRLVADAGADAGERAAAPRAAAEQGTLLLLAEKDVTQLRAEQERHARERLLARLGHELRTPLNAIIGFTGTLLMKLPGPLNADQESQLLTVQGSGMQLLSLIDELLASAP